MYNRTNSGGSRGFAKSRSQSSKNFSRRGYRNSFHSRSRGPRRRNFKSDYLSDDFYINKNVTAGHCESYKPKNNFTDFCIDEKIKSSIINKKYTTPTPIQDMCIPLVLENKDIIGLADTGTGKTAAFLIPLIHQVIKNPSKKILIIAPTRELAEQINMELRSFVYGMGIYSALITGGANIKRQIFDLRRRYNFVIGTPGRITDLIKRRILRLDNISTAVIDEADRMLDMGFIDDVRAILDQTSRDKQTLLFSATLSLKIEKLIQDFLKNPVKISVKNKDINNIFQDIVKYSHESEKPEMLLDILNKKESQKVLVFTKTKRQADELSKYLLKYGMRNALIHGDKQQSKRRRALDDFKKEQVKVMIATDVAARGLDICDVSHVINYDKPMTKEDYIHRIGRTARANKTGIALTFIKERSRSNHYQKPYFKSNKPTFSNKYHKQSSRKFR
jgi:superfamily II DNA/RNA helicase